MKDKEMKQLNLNIRAYEEMKADLLANSLGKTALFSDGKLIEIYNDKLDAYKVGVKDFGVGNFSIKEIGEKPYELGFVGLSVSSGSSFA
jgi:hypothetical protein